MIEQTQTGMHRGTESGKAGATRPLLDPLPSRRRVLIGIGGLALLGLALDHGLRAQVLSRPQPNDRAWERVEEPGPGRHVFSIHAVGWEWRYTVHVTESYSHGRPAPVVLVLHGSGGQGATVLEKSGWARKAEEGGFLAVAPDALPANPFHTANFWVNPRIWNAGQLPPEAARARINDTDFFRMLLDDLERHFTVDSARIYVTGHSNGAAMTFKLGAELSERLAAIAPVASVCWVKDPQPIRPVPTLFIAGTSDPLVPPQGGESVLPWGKRTTPPIVATLELWARALGCSCRPRLAERRGQLQLLVYGPGRDRTTLTAYLVDGQGHNWPGGKEIVPILLGPENPRFSATETIWAFFQKHRNRPSIAPFTTDGRRLEEPVKIVR